VRGTINGEFVRGAVEASGKGYFFPIDGRGGDDGWLRPGDPVELVWIDGTKRRPDVRAERTAELVRLLKKGIEQR
jgi:hypothetical protein